MEPVERLDLGIQRAGSNSEISRYGEAGEVSWSSACSVITEGNPMNTGHESRTRSAGYETGCSKREEDEAVFGGSGHRFFAF